MIHSQVPLVSVIIPVYNADKYLDRCLSSIITQTYTSIEIILIDDGSKDNSASICDSYAAKDNRITVIHKENEGQSVARNIGTDTSTGEYILYVDADDEIPQNAISLFIEKLNEHPQAEMVVGEIKSIPNDPTRYSANYYKRFDYIDNNLWVREHFYRFKNRLATNPVNKLIKRSFITQNQLNFKPGIIHEDELWMFHISQRLSRLAFVHEATYLRYINPNSIMTGSSDLKKSKAWGIILKEIFNHFSEPAWKEQYFAYTKQWMNFYNPHNKFAEYEDVWEKIVEMAIKKRLFFFIVLMICYKKSYPILQGHGIGFIIWATSKIVYKQAV
ncbi:glycosyltransferase [Fibrobacter sp. UWEL]|uniref:glycosyltransferase family 2 protein n=1 Tax=Fibrobacter sp. UWEL TaxID=1896209 RepID=UPI00091E1F2C|nr:glycosyltransferase [Fibrobacter sp. UWEL]SHL48524.1 Glycosyltransferase involved in cell wall bisynthesis [Fibrobacter sp. UWEL]